MSCMYQYVETTCRNFISCLRDFALPFSISRVTKESLCSWREHGSGGTTCVGHLENTLRHDYSPIHRGY
jgi:hypothetical protein